MTCLDADDEKSDEVEYGLGDHDVAHGSRFGRASEFNDTFASRALVPANALSIWPLIYHHGLST